jgi:hypothetical protein
MTKAICARADGHHCKVQMGENWHSWLTALVMDLTSHIMQRTKGLTPLEAAEYERRMWNWSLYLFRRPMWKVLTK